MLMTGRKDNQSFSEADKIVLNFTELKVYKLAFSATQRIFNLSRSWPLEEKYSLTNQIMRSSRSICANIAEAWKKRRYPAHFISKLSDADAEAAETQVWLEIAYECSYICYEDKKQLCSEYNHICSMLYSMMNSPKKWTLKSERSEK